MPKELLCLLDPSFFLPHIVAQKIYQPHRHIGIHPVSPDSELKVLQCRMLNQPLLFQQVLRDGHHLFRAILMAGQDGKFHVVKRFGVIAPFPRGQGHIALFCYLICNELAQHQDDNAQVGKEHAAFLPGNPDARIIGRQHVHQQNGAQ